MCFKGLLKRSTVVILLGLIFLAPFQTYAEFINTVDNEVTEILKESESEGSDETESEASNESESEETDESESEGSDESESEETDESESEESDESKSGESDESAANDGIELERERYPGFELNDDSFDKEVLEEDSFEAGEKSNSHVVTVSNETQLRNSIATAPIHGILRIIEVDRDFNLSGFVQIPHDSNIILRSNNVNQNRTLTQTGLDRHFRIMGKFTLAGGITLTTNVVSALPTTAGGVYVNPLGSFTMSGGEISGNQASSGGGVLVGQGGVFTMECGEISGNEASVGGGVFVNRTGSFTMEGGEISDNKAASGGGVNASVFTLKGGEISGNEAFNGGGVYVHEGGEFTMEDGKISNNQSNSEGGGVTVMNNGKFTMTDGEISGNQASVGGGVFVGQGGVFTMERGRISGNSFFSVGGGVAVVRGVFTMEGGEISGSTGTGSGGGVGVHHNSTFRMTGGEISGNRAFSGGGVNVDNSEFTMEGGQISANIASRDGGGIFLSSRPSMTLTGPDVEIFDNEALRYGGGIATNSFGVVLNGALNNIQIFNNKAEYGGGIYLTNSNGFTLNNTFIEENNAVRGGGIYVDRNNEELFIGGGRITLNEADVVGGIYVSDEALNNTTITRNTYVADNKTTTNIRMFNNLYNETHNINANGRINPLPWDGLDNSHVFNTVDMNTSSFKVVVRLKNNFEASNEPIFREVEFNVTDLVEFSPQFWDEHIAGNIPTRIGYKFTGWSFTPEGEIIDHTQLSNEVILNDLNLYAQWEPDPTYLNVSIPTALYFQSNHEDATQLVSPTYTITNHSVMGVHVNIAGFEATSHGTGVDLVEELNLQSIGPAPTPTRLITNGSIESIPTNSRLLELPGDTDGSFKFSGQTNISSSQVETPSFNLVLSFQVAHVAPAPAE